MDGIHDLGGVEGFGPVPVKSGDKDFRDLEDWEKRAFALNWSPIAPGSVNRHSNLTPYRHPIMTPLMLSRPGAA